MLQHHVYTDPIKKSEFCSVCPVHPEIPIFYGFIVLQPSQSMNMNTQQDKKDAVGSTLFLMVLWQSHNFNGDTVTKKKKRKKLILTLFDLLDFLHQRSLHLIEFIVFLAFT